MGKTMGEPMKEKKMTKAEQKKLDRANKKDFIGRAFQVALTALAKGTADVTGGTKVQIAFTNFNRYIHLNAYGRSISVLIYRDGNIEVKLEEFAHSPYSEQLFVFTLEQERQKDFLKAFQKMLDWLVPLSFEKGVCDFHTFMDYVSRSTSIASAYQEMNQEWGEKNCRKK